MTCHRRPRKSRASSSALISRYGCGSAAAICRSIMNTAPTMAGPIPKWRRRSAARMPAWCASTTAVTSLFRSRYRCSASARGALMLSTQGADIDDMVEHERLAILKVFLVAASVMIVLSILLAGTIAEPVRRLAAAAESVRRRTRSRVEIPDFTRRRDEIGHLSGTLRDMTNALYSRIEAIESFAADVAHELKNPLTSLRSAVETLPLAKSDDSQSRLLTVIQHDVRRLDRLISDISDASRLDAELQRQESAPVDFAKLLTTLVAVANEVKRDDGVTVTLRFEGGSGRAFLVPGHDSRLGQIVYNLIENARSFSPQDGTVRVTCRRLKSDIEILVDDY